MRVFLLSLLLICLPAFGAGADMQWQAPKILPPKGEAAASTGASNGAARAASASPGAGNAASASAGAAPTKPATGVAAVKPGSAPDLASKIKEKLEQTQQPAPKRGRMSESRSSSSFMTQEEFRARLAAAAVSAKNIPPPAPVKLAAKVRSVKPVSLAPKANANLWSYSGAEGPEHWGEMSVDWARCGSGRRQSPIDIRDGLKLELEAPLFEYQSSRFSVLDNGHTVLVNVNSPNYASLMGRRFQLTQFHFHRPSEERVNGRGSEMVMHLVHKDEEGRLLVVAVLIERGEPNAQVQSVWNNLPLEKNEILSATVRLDIAQLLPARREYYTYMGSLTTPPCTEGVLWVVMKQPITLSDQQIAIFARLYPMNARPLQAAGDRMIKESN